MAEQGPTYGRPKKILLATDLSARCDRALDRAAQLAGTWKAELVVVHALEQADDFYAEVLEQRLPSWRNPPDRTNYVRDQLRRDVPEVAQDVTIVVEKASPPELVLRTAETYGCDLIVTGIARNEALGRVGLGSTVDRLVRGSRAPLLVVKERMRGPYARVVVATDLSESSRHALTATLAMFPDQAIDIFHAYEVPPRSAIGEASEGVEEYRKQAMTDCAAFLAATDMPAARRQGIGIQVEWGHPSRLLQQYVHERGIDLVVVATHGRSALFNVLIGSTAKDVLTNAPCDVLLVREPKAKVE